MGISNASRVAKHNFKMNDPIVDLRYNVEYNSLKSLYNHLRNRNESVEQYYRDFLMVSGDSLVCECGNPTKFIPGLNYGYTETCEQDDCQYYYNFLVSTCQGKSKDKQPYRDVRTGKLYLTARSFSNHLRTENLTAKQYYDIYVKTDGEGICHCGNQTSFDSIVTGYREYCKPTCEHIVNKRTLAVKDFVKANKDAITERFKLYHSNATVDQIESNNQKRFDTIRSKCELMGISVHEYRSSISKKSYETFRRNCPDFEQHINKCMISRSTSGKSTFKKYDYDGNEISVQGYEPIVLDYIKQTVPFDDIEVGGKAFCNYGYVYRGNNHRYYPDIKYKNVIIEVKSDYTFNKSKERNIAKFGSIMMNNMVCVVVIPTRKEARNGKLEGSKKLLDWAISSQASNHSGCIVMYDEGSTTILYGVESSDSKSRGSLRQIREYDIVWSVLKDTAVDVSESSTG